MGLSKDYMDLILVPSGLLLIILYHGWLWHKVRSQPQQTAIVINSAGLRLWVIAMTKDISKDIVVVQSIRNAIMGSTLMATTSILLSSGLAVLISSTYSIKKPIDDSVYGMANGEFVVAMKYAALLLAFLFSFLFHSLSIRFMNQASFLINILHGGEDGGLSENMTEYGYGLLEKGFVLNTLGNRLFYAALPLVLWIFEPVLVFLSSILLVIILYNMDIVYAEEMGGVGRKVEDMGSKDSMGG